MFQGETGVFDLTFTRLVNNVPTPVDLTGAEIWFTIKRYFTDADPGIVQLTVGSGIVVAVPSSGLATATVPNTTTPPIVSPASLVYDVKLKEADGTYTIPIFGPFTVKPAVTDAT